MPCIQYNDRSSGRTLSRQSVRVTGSGQAGREVHAACGEREQTGEQRGTDGDLFQKLFHSAPRFPFWCSVCKAAQFYAKVQIRCGYPAVTFGCSGIPLMRAAIKMMPCSEDSALPIACGACRHPDTGHTGNRGDCLFGINGQGLTFFIACRFDMFINDCHFCSIS